MKLVATCICLLICSSSISSPSDSSQPADVEIARSIRAAVRDADQELLSATILGDWRDYLKVAAINLDLQLQPLLLIKFDQDVRFRAQLKQLIEWESHWVRMESEHYIYYSRPEQPIPELLLGIQDAHFQELTGRFAVTLAEKIPYRYDLTVDAGRVHPFDDLRGGIVSSQPFDLESAALAIFKSINPDIPFLTAPLAKIYGSHYQNQPTSEAHFTHCMRKLKTSGYVSFLQGRSQQEPESLADATRSSAYAFVFKLTERFQPPQITQFLAAVKSEMSEAQVLEAFQAAFNVTLAEFERGSGFRQMAAKF